MQAELNIPSEDFPGRGEKGSNSEIDIAYVRARAERNPLLKDAVEHLLKLHLEFLETGGKGGKFHYMNAGSGVPLIIYVGHSDHVSGEQLNFSMKNISGLNLFTKVNMSFGIFAGIHAVEVNFNESILEKCQFQNSNLINASFKGSDLSYADLTGSDLQNADFRAAKLIGTDFENTNCTNADFTNAQMIGCSFKGAVLNNIRR